jgi:cytochrome bd-type quinol oxidase subunit 2
MALGQATPETSRGSARRTLAWAGAVALAVLLWGGYGRHWPWTGINGRTATLWDWMHLLLLPLAVAILSVWSRRDTRVHPRSKLYAGTALALLIVVVILGYVVPWAWTGFRGNTLWDWFNLIFLPLTLVLVPRFVELRDRWQRRHTVRTAALGAIFVALVIGGYVASWRWTGFTGNTLWNWMNLLFLPLLVPTVILPAFTPIAMRRVIYLDENGDPVAAPTPAGGPPAAVDDGEGTPAPLVIPPRPQS